MTLQLPTAASAAAAEAATTAATSTPYLHNTTADATVPTEANRHQHQHRRFVPVGEEKQLLLLQQQYQPYLHLSVVECVGLLLLHLADTPLVGTVDA